MKGEDNWDYAPDFPYVVLAIVAALVVVGLSALLS